MSPLMHLGGAVVAVVLGFTAPALAGQVEPQPVRVGGDVKPPVRLKTVKPVYSAAARAKRLQGVVILEVLVGTDGKVRSTRVLRSLPALDDAAVDAVKQWEFKPTLVAGKPTPVLVTLPISFNLE